MRRAEQVSDEREGVDIVLLTGPQDAHQDFLRARPGGGAISAPHLANDRGGSDRLLGPIVRRLQPGTLQIREQEGELPVEMVGQAAILVRPIAGVQEPRECRLQAARGALQAVGRDLLGGEAIPQGQAWLQEGLDLPGEDGRRGRRLLEEAGTAVDEMVIAGLLVGRRERAVDGGPVAHQEPVDVGAQQRLGVGGAAAGRNREHRRVRRGGGKQPVGHPVSSIVTRALAPTRCVKAA